MMNRYLLLLIIGLLTTPLLAQSPAKYWIQFEDKKDNSFSVERPHEFLSQRALEKRRKFDISITEEDLPVSRNYIETVLGLDSTMTLLHQSKWLNGITVYCESANILKRIKTLPFVRDSECTIKMKEPERSSERYSYAAANYRFATRDTAGPAKELSYGKAEAQVRTNNAHWLHRMGYKGEGMLMMFIDGGFHNIDSIRHLSTLFTEERFFGARNFVAPGVSPLRDVSHGTSVLSCVASYVPGELIGTAPKASVYVAQTEDKRSENKVEEDNWIAAMEWADSLGCDVVNSSLGYTNFDDKEQYRRVHADLTGEATRISTVAGMAAKRGMLICNSAGNEGNKRWGKISFPADSRDILTVAAIDIQGERAEFSSCGGGVGGRIKPDVCAVGKGTYVANPFGKTTSLNGTSFSSPLMAGMVACLWQMFPEKTNYDIMDAVKRSGDQANNPDTLLGYGCPDFLKAYNLLQYPESFSTDLKEGTSPYIVLDKAVSDGTPFTFNIYTPQKATVDIRIQKQGETLQHVSSHKLKKGFNRITLKDLPVCAAGRFGFAELSVEGTGIGLRCRLGMEPRD